MKRLLDENVSPWVAAELSRVDGLDICHVRDRGLLAATDAEVLERAYAEDRVLVTANVADFLKLARAREIHPGIVLFEGVRSSVPSSLTRSALAWRPSLRSATS